MLIRRESINLAEVFEHEHGAVILPDFEVDRFCDVFNDGV